MITLTRDSLSGSGTHGIIEFAGETYHTLEQPDLGNIPFRSCVPQGDYILRPYRSPKYGHCFILVNEDLNVYEFKRSKGRGQTGRFLCLFVHKGNYVSNFQGCIGAGRAYLGSNDMITKTKHPCLELNAAVLAAGETELRIRHEVE